jgi:hypothetical protein
MAKKFITGAAQSPSDEEFKQRLARLAPLPAVAAQERRPPKSKPAFKPKPDPSSGATEDGLKVEED